MAPSSIDRLELRSTCPIPNQRARRVQSHRRAGRLHSLNVDAIGLASWGLANDYGHGSSNAS